MSTCDNLIFIILLSSFLFTRADLPSSAASTDLSLKKASFQNVVGGKHNVFIKFYAPWCTHCKRLEPSWLQLMSFFNKQLDKHRVLIARVDCTTEADLCRSEKIVGYPTLKLYLVDEKMGTDYEGPRDLRSLQEFLTKQLNIEISEEELIRRESSDGPPIPSDEEEDDDLLGKESWDEKAPEPVNGLHELTDENYKDFLSRGRHFVKFYAPWCGHCQRLAPIWEQLADTLAFDTTVHISKIDCDMYRDVCHQYKVEGYPTLLWIVDGEVVDKYGGSRSHESLKLFVDQSKKKDLKLGLEKGTVRSEDVLLILTDENFKSSIKQGLTFVKFWVPWCTHCKRLEPIWDELAKKLVGKANVAKLDCSTSEKTCESFNVDGYPTLILFKDGEKVTEYEDERALFDLTEFVNSHAMVKDEL